MDSDAARVADVEGGRRRVVVITGGGSLAPSAVTAVSAGTTDRELVVAADSGLDHARAAGFDPDLLVGDLDSISSGGLAWAAASSRIQRHDPDKAATDTELAIAAALAGGADELVVVAGDGDRIDHQLATIGAAGRAAAAHPATTVRAWIGATELRYVTPARVLSLSLAAGTTFSLLALDGAVDGVAIRGARWPLTDATLAALDGLGVSNVAVDDPVVVSLATGVAAVVIPVLDDPPPDPPTPTGGSR